MRGRKHRLSFVHAVLAIVALALVVRLLVIVATPNFTPRNDAVDYDRNAVSLAQQGRFPGSQETVQKGPTAFRAPLYPIMLAGVYKVVGVSSVADRWRAARLLQALLGALAVGLILLIALRLWGREVALACGVLAAVYPPLLLVGSSLMPEPLYIPLLLGAVLSALQYRASPRRLRWAGATGVLLGLTILTRANDIALLLPIGFLLWSGRLRGMAGAWRGAAIMTAVTLLTLVPWTVRNAHAFHQFVPITTEGGYATVGTYNDYAARRTDYPALWVPPLFYAPLIVRTASHSNEAEISDQLNTIAFHYIEAHPAYLLRVAFWNTLRQLNLTGTGFERWIEPTWGYSAGLAEVSVYAFWLAGALALVGALSAAARRAPWSFWAVPVLIFLITVMFTSATRYRAPADPFVIMLAVLGARAAWRRWAKRDPPPLPSRAA